MTTESDLSLKYITSFLHGISYHLITNYIPGGKRGEPTVPGIIFKIITIIILQIIMSILFRNFKIKSRYHISGSCRGTSKASFLSKNLRIFTARGL